MRFHPIFFVSLLLSAQVTQESWVHPIEDLIRSGDLTQAHQRLERETAARGETASALYLQAKILFEERRFHESLQAAQRSMTLAPDDAEVYKLAALSAIRIDRLDIAEPALQMAARLSPGDYLVRFHLGALYYTQSLFLAARPELEKAAKLNPRYMPALLFLGLTLEEVGDEKATVAMYRDAMEVAAKSGAGKELPYLYLGRFYYRLNRLEDSLPLLEKAVEINPSSADAQLQLGKALHALTRDKRAVDALERSVAANSQDPEPHYLLWRIFESEGRGEAAQEELKRFQELSRQQPASDRARRRLQMSSR